MTVPRDEGQGPEPLLMHLEHTGTTSQMSIYWPAVAGALAYDLIRGDLSSLRVGNNQVSLGAVRVLARGTTGTAATESSGESIPAPGQAFIYQIQYRTETGVSGYGAETAPWPRVPESCEGGCPP